MIFSKNILVTVLGFANPNKKLIILASIYSAINKVCDILPEILLAVSIDVVVRQQSSFVATYVGIVDPVIQLYVVGSLTAIIWIMESIFEYLYFMTWRNVAQSVQNKLRVMTYDKIQSLDLNYFEKTTSGGLLMLLQDDVQEMETFISKVPNEAIQLLVNILVIGTVFVCVSPQLFLLTIVPIPFVILVAYYFQQKLSKLYKNIRYLSSSLMSHIIYRLNSLETIKSYNSERYELSKLAVESNKYKVSFDNINFVTAQYIPSVRMIVMIGFIITLIVGGLKVLNGEIAIQWYAELVFLIQRFLWPFANLTTISDMYEKSVSSALRILDILHMEPVIVDGEHAVDLKVCPGRIEFSNVSFSYSSGYEVFDKLTLAIEPKTTVAFVGSTGSGKSTLAKLLLRFYDVQSGSIMIDGYDIKNIKLHNLRSSIGLVSQEVYIIDGTIGENIAYGTFNATQEDIENAAKMAQLHEFIMELPGGYNSKMGENGKNLSGGQRQRIAIARTLLKKSCTLIFDEATSALDNETESEITKAMASLRHHHTIIIIAHRLSTVRHADVIFFLDNGAVLESGSHQELLDKNGAYAQLLRHTN